MEGREILLYYYILFGPADIALRRKLRGSIPAFRILSPGLILPRQPLRKIRFNDAEGSRAYIQEEAVEFHVGIAAAKGFLGLALHAQDFQVAHIILQVIGRILRYVIIDGGNDRGIADAEVVV